MMGWQKKMKIDARPAYLLLLLLCLLLRVHAEPKRQWMMPLSPDQQ